MSLDRHRLHNYRLRNYSLQCIDRHRLTKPLFLSPMATIPGAAAWMVWDVTPHIQDALHEGLDIVTFLLRDTVEGGISADRIARWYSRDYADDITLRPVLKINGVDFSATKDTYINQISPNTNYGDGASIQTNPRTIQVHRAIISFPLHGVSCATSATLRLFNHFRGTGTSGRMIQVVKLTRPDWIESEATWNVFKAGSNWTTAGGDFTDQGKG